MSNASLTPVALIVSKSPDNTDDRTCRYSVLSSTTNIRFISFYRLSHSNLDRARIVCAGDSDVVRSSLKLNGNASAGRFRKHLLLQVRGDVNELTVPIKRIKLVSDYNFTALIFLEVGVSNQNILSVKSSYRSVIGGQKSIVVRSPAALKRLIRGYKSVAFPNHYIIT